MTGFPFQLLPQKELFLVLNRVSLLDIYHLSLCSQRMCNLVITYTRTLNPLPIDIDDGYVCINGWIWNFITARNPKNVGLRNYRNRYLHGRPFFFYDNAAGERFCVTCTPQYYSLLFAYYLMCVFPCQIQNLRIRIDEFECLEEIQTWRFLHASQKLTVYDGAVSHREMYAFLERFLTNELVIECHPGKRFVYEKPISVFKLEIANSSWLSRYNLLNLNCSRVTLHQSTLTEADLNAFLYQWLFSDNQLSLEYIHITGKAQERGEIGSTCGIEGFEDLDMDQVLMGLNTISGTHKRAESTTFEWHFKVPYEDGVDLRRADGKLGTVLKHQRFAECKEPFSKEFSFLFVVWQDQWPYAAPNWHIPIPRVLN